MPGICYIVGAGPFGKHHFLPEPGDCVIAADAGYLQLQKLGIAPDLVVGDFDSMQPPPQDVPVLPLNPVKDETDMHAAIQQGLERGYCRFSIYGGMGGRLSHTLANMQLVAWLSQQGFHARLFGERETLTAITNGAYRFSAQEKGYLSVFAHTDTCLGVTEIGLAYALQGATLTNTFPLGVSNEFLGQESEVCVQNGTLLLLWGENNN